MRILIWFRKDLRLDDHTALSEAARDATGDVVPFYTSEPSLLGRPDLAATRVRFVLDSLHELASRIAAAGSHLALAHGDAADTVLHAARASNADAVYWNDEYEPALRTRDDAVEASLLAAGIAVRRFHDRLLVPPGEVLTGSGTAYTVYTPFRRACEKLPLSRPLPTVSRFAAHDLPRRAIASLDRLGIPEPSSERWPGGASAAEARLSAFLEDGSAGLSQYATERDFPAVRAHARLSADLKFGTLGIRRVADAAIEAARGAPALAKHSEKFITELRWRDFYAHVMHHFPHCEHGAFRPEFDAIRWSGRDAWFDAWREGRTGYPIVDAGMRELLATGFMHNRTRMVVASFLTKDLLIDWRRGERHFMQHLVDGDLASNNGGWQWAAGTGTDAAPYFRIFNPVLQSQRFDAEGDYVRRWVPELAALPNRHLHAPWRAPLLVLAEHGIKLGEHYPHPIVDHAEQREQALAMYGELKGA